METYTFEELAGDERVFFSEHFGKKPLLRRGALKGSPRDLLSVRQLDDVVALEAVQPAYVRVSKDGKGVPSRAYTRTVTSRGAALAEAVVPENLHELFRSGGTVTWNSLNHFLPPVRRLLEVFTDTFACGGEVVAFLTPAGAEGYAPHHDPVDVFVVQIEGTKRWRLWDPSAARREEKASYGPGELGQPSIETTLAAGDVLYLPCNTPHAAAAEGEISLHLSITVEPRRWRDLLRDTVEAIAAGDGFGEFPYLGDERSAAADLAGKLRLLAGKLAAVDPAPEVQRLAALGRRQGGASRPREFERLSALDVLGPDVRLRRSSVPVEIGESDGSRTGLLVNGHRLAVPDAVAAALRQLGTGGSVAAGGFFPGVSETRSLRAAQGLARLGVLEVADETRN